MSAEIKECEEFQRRHGGSAVELHRQGKLPSWLVDRDQIEQKLRTLGYVE